MAIQKIKLRQLQDSTTPGSLVTSDTGNLLTIVAPSTGADHLWFYDHSATAVVPLTVGTNLSITGTTLNASAGAGGYSEIQEEGSALTARTKFNIIGSGLTATDDAGNTRTNISVAAFLNTLATAGTVGLASGDVSGTLPVSKGGTGTITGSITGTGALVFTAGATNTNITLIPNGTGTVDVSSKKIANLADPTNPQDGATKFYVDSQIQGLNPKGRVRVATTVAGTLATSFANGQVVDGITLATNDRILIKNQAAPAENGIRIVQASGAPTRATDMDAWSEVISAYVLVEVGTANADTGWLCTSDTGGTLDTTAINWVQFSAAGIITATNGLTKTANDIALGGTLSTSPTIAGTSTFFLTVNGSRTGATNASLEVLNSGVSGAGTKSTTSGSGAGVWGISSSGAGVYGSSTTGYGIGGYTPSLTAGAGLLQVDAADGSSVTPILILDRSNSGGAGANGIGGSISFKAETTTTASVEANTISSSWTDATHATRQSNLVVRGQNGSTTNLLFSLLGNGQATLNNYGAGTFTGTATKTLQVTAAGVIIEGPISSSVVVTRAYLTGSTASVIDLDSGTAVTDKAGTNITFTTAGLSADQIFVVRNGVTLSESGTPARDYTLNTSTGVLTLVVALTTDEQLMVYKIA
jgi:hypothetical protein